MSFNRTSLLKDWTIATSVKDIDLPTNPISHLIITMDCYNATDEATLAELLTFVNKIEIVRNSITQVSIESEHLAALTCFLLHAHPLLTNNLATDNESRALTLLVPLGRKLYDVNECLPATPKGEAKLKIDITVPSSSADNGVLNVECVELPGATPSRHLRYIQKNVTAPGQLGNYDVNLPLGNKIAAVLLWNTTVPTTSSHTYGIETATVKLNNNEYGYSQARMHCLIGEWQRYLQTLPRDIAAAGSTYPSKFAVLDFMPNGSDEYLIDTSQLKSAKLVLDMGVDEVSQITPLEITEVGGA
jgi:hypothetical protein